MIFPRIFVRNISHSKNNSASYYQKRALSLHVKLECQIVMKSEFFSTDVQKILKYQI